jgi:hypothetical protein
MQHFPPYLYIKSADWARKPPTGSTLASELEAVLSEPEYVGELARLAGRTEEYVRWQLSLDSIVPACLLTAALRLRKLRVLSTAESIAERRQLLGAVSLKDVSKAIPG